MTECNRCGEDFENFFNGYNWCPNCGKVFVYNLSNFVKNYEESFSEIIVGFKGHKIPKSSSSQ